MLFPSPLKPGRLVRRYKRFLADIVLDNGEEITAHCANPGSMLTVLQDDARVWVSRSANKARKLPYSWEIIELEHTRLAVNTSNPNKIVAEALDKGAIPELKGYETINREVAYGENSRVDFLLEGNAAATPCYLEVKNVHLSRERGLAEFPDSVTARGTKHLQTLQQMCENGARAVLLFVVQRTDCHRFRPAADLDPVYAQSIVSAVDAGVELLCYDCDITLEEVVLRKALEVEYPS